MRQPVNAATARLGEPFKWNRRFLGVAVRFASLKRIVNGLAVAPNRRFSHANGRRNLAARTLATLDNGDLLDTGPPARSVVHSPPPRNEIALTFLQKRLLYCTIFRRRIQTTNNGGNHGKTAGD